MFFLAPIIMNLNNCGECLYLNIYNNIQYIYANHLNISFPPTVIGYLIITIHMVLMGRLYVERKVIVVNRKRGGLISSAKKPRTILTKESPLQSFQFARLDACILVPLALCSGVIYFR